MNEIKETIENINNSIFLVREKLKKLWQCSSTPSLEISVFEDELHELESQLEKEQNRLRENIELEEYQKSCTHSFVEDLIDIDPDKSKIIRYCIHCLFTDEN
jgi:hypothetical protein